MMTFWANALTDWGVYGTVIGFIGTLLIARSVNIDPEEFKMVIKGQEVSVATLYANSKKLFKLGVVLLFVALGLLFVNELNVPFINRWF